MTDTKNELKLSSDDFVKIMQMHFDKGYDVDLTVTGNSMIPFLADKRDVVHLSCVKKTPIKGDVCLYRRSDGNCVLHRVVKADDSGLYFLGDAQITSEGPLPYDVVLAQCNSVRRKGKEINNKNFIWSFFRNVWINMIPFRRIIIKFISIFKH